MNTIRRGSKGEDVKTWQRIVGATTDGDFGPATEAKTRAWQAARGLVADGIVGPATWAAAGKVEEEPPSTGAIPFIQAKSFTRAARGMGKITAIVIHTMEAPEGPATAENVAAWFAGASAPRASAHYNVDPNSIVQSVRDEDIAWHAGPVNDWSIGIEHAGYAKQTAEEWADAASTAILERSAELVAGLCARWEIPVRRLTADDLKRGERAGIFGHVDVTNGLTGGKGHYDPGPHFPWDRYLANVRAKVEALTPKVADEAAADTEPPPVPGFVEVEYAGEIWLVEPMPMAFVSLGQAEDRAARAGCELPSPGLVDAIWRAADLKISPAETIQSHNGTASGMNNATIYAKVTAAVDAALDGRIVGDQVRLVAGAWKDVVRFDGKLAIYGWHVADPAAFRERLKARLGATVPLYEPFTPGPGLVVQECNPKAHDRNWRDYSQCGRLVRRKSKA